MSGVGVCNCLRKRNIILQPDPKDWPWDSNRRPSTLNKYATCQTVRSVKFTVFLPVDFNCLPRVDLGITWNELRHFFWTRKSHHIIIIFLHKKWRHAFAGRDSLCHRLYHLRPVNLVCQVAFRQAAAFRKHRLNLWASRTRPAGQWRRALNACLGGGGVGGVCAIFLGNFSVNNKSKAEELRSWCCYVLFIFFKHQVFK